MYLFILYYADCDSVLAVSFHTRENPIKLFRENGDIESNHLQPALKCRGFL